MRFAPSTGSGSIWEADFTMQRAKKSYGQNWLVDETAVKKLIDASQIKKGERVLEIGPGTGIITQALLDAGAKVTAVELDHELIEVLRERFGDRIELIEGNGLKFPYPDLTPFKIVSSIPYHITSDFLKTFLTAAHPPVLMCLVVQKEVAERIVAKPPRMSLLSVACQVYAKCEYIATIKAGAFRPIPKVDSAIVRLTLEDGEAWLARMQARLNTSFDPEEVIRVAKAGFSSKRKQLHNNLPSLPGSDGALSSKRKQLHNNLPSLPGSDGALYNLPSLPGSDGALSLPGSDRFLPAFEWRAEPKRLLEEAGLAGNVRAENLTVDEWVRVVGKMRGV